MIKDKFLSSDNKTEITYYFFEPKVKKPIAIVQISHGMQDYILRYSELIEHLNNNGIVVCGNDDLGHGSTSTSSETDGYFANKDGHKFVLKDLHTMSLIAKNKHPNLPYILMGHSMGSFFARYFAYHFPDQLDGLILLGTSGKVSGTSMGIAILSFFKTFMGEKFKSKLFEDIMLKSYFKYIDEVVTRREWVTSDKEKLHEYENDPRCSFRFTVSAYQDMLKVLKFVNSKKWARGINKNLSIFIASGAKDPVGNYGKGVTRVYELLENQKIDDLQLKLYTDARHELHNEVNTTRQEFFKDVTSWIKERCL